MTDESLAERVAAARQLVEVCVRQAADDDLPATIRADMQETLEFLMRLDEALEERDRVESAGSETATGEDSESDDEEEDAHWEAHPVSGLDEVLFRPDDGERLGRWIAAERDDVESLNDWQ